MDWYEVGFTIVFSALRDSFRNPARKLKLRAGALKLAATINAVFASDDTFAIELKDKTLSEIDKLRKTA